MMYLTQTLCIFRYNFYLERIQRALSLLFLFFGLVLPAYGIQSTIATEQTVEVGVQNVCVASDQFLDASLSDAYLLEGVRNIGKPQLIVGHYNLSQGLLAAYQSETGKRIIFKTKLFPNGQMSAEILHLDPLTQTVVPLVGRSKQRDAVTGQAIADIEIAGVDVVSFLQGSGLKTDTFRSKEGQVQKFLRSDVGAALVEALPALYASLEAFEQEPEAAKLKNPFGAVAMALQLGTQQYNGFKHADKILGTANAKRFRDACSTDDCLFRGKDFTVYRSGLFDVLTKQKGISKTEPAQCGQTSVLGAKYQGVASLVLRSHVSAAPSRPQNGDGTCTPQPGDCFGYCGPGCLNPGNIITLECTGHDFCVCAYSTSACLVTVPESCPSGECSSLLDASLSYLLALIEAFLYYDDCADGIYSSDCPTP